MSVFLAGEFILASTVSNNNAQIGYRNIITRDNVTGTAAATGFPLTAIVNPGTYERYQPSAIPATISIDAIDPAECNYIGIAAHTLGSSACTVTLQHSSNGSTWSTATVLTPTDNQTIMGLFTSATKRYWRIVIAGTSIPQIGVVYLGKSLQMQRGIYGGHSPITLSRITVVKPSVSQLGQWLGVSQERVGFKTNFAWKNLTASWYRAEFDPFVATNPRVRPFFIAWRPQTFPKEVGYCWSTKDIQPSNSGGRDFMEVSLSVEGYNDNS